MISIDGEGTRRATGHTFFQDRRKLAEKPALTFDVVVGYNEKRPGFAVTAALKKNDTTSCFTTKFQKPENMFLGPRKRTQFKKAKGNAGRYLVQLYENDAGFYSIPSNELGRFFDPKTAEIRPKAANGIFPERRGFPGQRRRSRLRAANPQKAVLGNLLAKTLPPNRYKPLNLTFSKSRYALKRDDGVLYENRSKVAKRLEKRVQNDESMDS